MNVKNVLDSVATFWPWYPSVPLYYDATKILYYRRFLARCMAQVAPLITITIPGSSGTSRSINCDFFSLSIAARQPLCHKVNLQSCVAQQPLCHKVNLPRCEARRRRFIMTCDIFSTGQTNILDLCYLFGKTYKQPTVVPHSTLDQTPALIETDHTISLAVEAFSKWYTV